LVIYSSHLGRADNPSIRGNPGTVVGVAESTITTSTAMVVMALRLLKGHAVQRAGQGGKGKGKHTNGGRIKFNATIVNAMTSKKH
jgi:hypothetical protein